MLKAYLRYRLKRKGPHGVHSPFVFDFVTNVLNKVNQIDNSDIEQIRRKMVQNSNIIEVEDLGAGSKMLTGNKRKVSDIANASSVSIKFGRLLAKIVRHYECERIVELGTAVGIGTSYLAKGNPDAELITIEGSHEIAKLAVQNFEELGFKNIKQIVGSFDDELENTVSDKKLDLVYIDGNHQKEATLKYFQFYLDHISDDGLIIFDDIHWSSGMEEAWEQIMNSENINVSIDLFRMGIVSKKPGQSKEHFVLRY